MLRNKARTFAALLIAASLVLPSSAFAAAPEPTTAPAAPETKGVLAAPADQKDPGGAKLVDVKVSREAAIEIAKGAFAIPANMVGPNVNQSLSKDGAHWRLEWTSPKNAPERINISVGIDAITGIIGNYDRYAEMNEQQARELNFSRAEAKQKADEWLAKLAPDLKESLRFVDNPLQINYYGPGSVYTFQWDRMEQGYPVAGQGLTLNIDAQNGQLRSYYRSMDSRQLTYTLPESLLAQDKAEQAYREQLNMRLEYRYFYKPGTETGEWKLVYRPRTGWYPAVDQTGKLVGTGGQELKADQFKNRPLVPASDKPYAKPAKPMTREEALALAQAAAGRTDEPTSANYSEYGEEEKSMAWNFGWYTEGEMKMGEENTNVQIDVNTGLVVHFSSWGRYEPLKEDQKPKFTEEQASTTAIEFVRQNRPDLAGNLLMEPGYDRMYMEMEQIREYNFQFIQLKNYIPVGGRYVSVSVDAMTGAVRNFWGSNPADEEKQPFPKAEGLVKPEAVINAFLKHGGLELKWVTGYPEMTMRYGKPMPDREGKIVTQLLWSPKGQLPIESIDAKTGVPLDYSGRDLIEASRRPVDIAGHFAEREIELLWARGLFELKDGKFNPGSAVTVADMARWLTLARGMQPYPMYDFAMGFAGGGEGARATATNLAKAAEMPYFGAALNAGIMLPEDFADNTDPAAPVSRELAALWVVRAMGHGEIAGMANRIEMSFTDKASIGAKYANAVAILEGLSVVKGGADATFQPQRSTSRGEAAKLVFAVASKGRRYW